MDFVCVTNYPANYYILYILSQYSIKMNYPHV